MKKLLKITFLGLFLAAICSFGLFHSSSVQPIFAEPENSSSEPVSSSQEPVEPEPTEDAPAATVIIEKVDHAKITTSLENGNPGDVCIINVEADLFYLTQSVTVNGTALVESEDISGEYSFVLAEGENKILVKIGVDKELLGQFADIFEKVSTGNLDDLFSVRNIVAFVFWILNGGLLIAMVRYYIKDKRLAEKVEQGTRNAVSKVVPEETRKIVVSSIEKVITPMFKDIHAGNADIVQAMAVFAKCFALSQENTPESRKAILDELSGLKISDASTLETIKNYIDEAVAKYQLSYKEALEAIQNIGKQNEAILAENNEDEEEEVPADNGIQI